MKPKVFLEVIDSSRIQLRKHSLDLAETMFQYVNQDRERLRQFLPWVDQTNSVADILTYIKSTHDKWTDSTTFDFGIFDRSTGTYMGNIGVHSIQWDFNRCEFGYWILGEYEGKGFVSESVQTLEKLCFDLGFHRIEIRCSSLNERSAAVPKRLGYRHEGTLRENSIELGRYRDTMIFAKLNPIPTPIEIQSENHSITSDSSNHVRDHDK